MKTTGLCRCLLTAMLSLTLYNCTNNQNEEDEQVENLESFQAHVSEFGVNLFKSAATEFGDTSFVISPVGAQFTLSMAENILNSSDISKTFGYDNLSYLNIANKYLINKLYVPATVTEYGDTLHLPTKISNAVWFNYSVGRDTKKTLKKYYGAKVNKGDLTSPAEIKAVEAWCSEASGVQDLKPEIPDTKDIDIIIKSILSFDQQWDGDYHFSCSYQDTFLTPQGKRLTDFMDAKLIADYLANEKYESVILKLPPYNMVCVRPAASDLSELVNNFEVSDLQTIINDATEHSINLSFPLYKLNTNCSLFPLLHNIGINLEPVESSSPMLQANQMSTINVDQTGVAAGSVTWLFGILGLVDAENPIELKFDRPFIYFIIEPETQAILFAGQYTGPED